MAQTVVNDRAGELWEHGSQMYLVLGRFERKSWLALRVGDSYDQDSVVAWLAEEFFEQEWWERIA